VNWTINAQIKKAFFSRVAEITGCLEKKEQARDAHNQTN